MPGKESLRLQQYYAHPRNLFWKLLCSLFNETLPSNYEKKLSLLDKNQIALWDVCDTAFRETSLDSDIKNESPNDIYRFIQTHPTLKTIAFNGQKAEKLYNKYFSRIDKINYYTLLSTSPANASFSFQDKLDNWKTVFI